MPHPKGKSIRKGTARTLSGNGGIGIIICEAVFTALLSGTPSDPRTEWRNPSSELMEYRVAGLSKAREGARRPKSRQTDRA